MINTSIYDEYKLNVHVSYEYDINIFSNFCLNRSYFRSMSLLEVEDVFVSVMKVLCRVLFVLGRMFYESLSSVRLISFELL